MRSAASARTSETEATLDADDEGPGAGAGAAGAPQLTAHPIVTQLALVILIRLSYVEQVVFVRHAIIEALHPHRIAFAATPVEESEAWAQSELAC
jgi:hypothetical protein